MGGTQLFILSRHQEGGRNEVELLQTAKVLHFLDVLKKFVFASQLVGPKKKI